MEELRADPEELLRQINAEAAAEQRGRLKIFFGYAAGVGKTYAMLKAAQAARHRGIDVVAGYVEPHARPQTTALLDGLEQIDPLSITYKGIVVTEFDLDAAIRRHPRLILVDELAHTNAEGCRHTKRYQDVEELLKAGIDVYTTVNVQHIESLNDIVASISGVLVRERIPDKVFDRADQVELVDIEPVDLIERLQAGKIYREGQAQRALNHFFTAENLAALREIALRRCADRVNRLSEKVRQAQGGYATDEHILVCLSSSPTNAKIIRTAARMASAFKANFTALFVETPEFPDMRDPDKNRLRANINLAQQLGATIETVYGDDVPFQIAEFARLSGVSKIVLGRSSAGRRGLLRKPPLTERLTIAAPNLDIYIIPDKSIVAPYKPVRAKGQPFELNWYDVGKSILLLALATGIGTCFSYFGFSEANIITIYILSVLFTAIVTSHRIYSLVSSIISVLTFNFFFTAPYFSLEAYDRGYPVTFFIMFLSAFLTGRLAVRIKQHAQRSTQTAYRTKILLDTNQLLQKTNDKDSVASVTGSQLAKLLRKDVVFYPVERQTLAPPIVFYPTEQSGPPEQPAYLTDDNEKAVASWVFMNNKHAGATTDTLGNAKCLYLAVRVNEVVYGVVGIVILGEPLDAFENSIVLSILGECALALENLQALQEREEAAVLAKNEQLRANLLRSISHDLRTPLTAISGNAGILLASADIIDPEKRKALYTDIYDDSLWLINLVENLLSVTRIEDGSMRLNVTAELMEEVVSEAMNHLSRKSVEHQIRVESAEEFILAKMDARLIVQVLINMVDNAVKYTPAGSEIIVHTSKKDSFAVVSISDTGAGIPDEAKSKIFDMFYTATPGLADSRRSLGLGLALCKSIVTAHGGEISVRDNYPTGTIFTFTLPLEEVALHE